MEGDDFAPATGAASEQGLNDSELDRLRRELLAFLVDAVVRDSLGSGRIALGEPVVAAIRDAVDEAAQPALTASISQIEATADQAQRQLIESGGVDVGKLADAVAERLPAPPPRDARREWVLAILAASVALASFVAGLGTMHWIGSDQGAPAVAAGAGDAAAVATNLSGQIRIACDALHAAGWPRTRPTPLPTGSPGPSPSTPPSGPEAALQLVDGPFSELCAGER